MPKPGHNGLRRILSATSFSIAGVRAAWKHEAAFRQECLLAAILIPVAFWLGQTGLERAVLVLTCFIVLITELLNSAIEAVVDRVGDEVHPLAGRAKDMGSAAVFLSLASVVVVWGLIAYQRFAS